LTQSTNISRVTGTTLSEINFPKGASTMALTKTEVIDSVKNKIGFTRKQSIETVEILLEIIKSTLESGEDVLITIFSVD